MRRVSGLIVSLPRVPQTHNSTRRSLDRKSTRLNSSHQIISYAVFCLKKKKKCQNIVDIDKPGAYAKSGAASSKGRDGALSMSRNTASPPVVLHNQYYGSQVDSRNMSS